MRRIWTVALTVAVAAAAGTALDAAPAMAAPNIPASFAGVSPDGQRVWFRTEEPLPGTGDTDAAADLYERLPDNTVRLISTGGANTPVTFVAASTDGRRVWFRTTEAVPGTGDNDTAADIYERLSNGVLRLISTGGGANVAPAFTGASATGAKVWFETDEAIPGTGDNDTERDVYERDAGGSLRLVSRGTPNQSASFVRGSADGFRVWFTTQDQIPGTGDTDTARDVYERTPAGTVALISTGGANTDAHFAAASPDGARVWFSTAEAIPGTADADGGSDYYERNTTTGALRLATTSGTNDATVNLRLSADGSRVWFETVEAIPGTGDTDVTTDIYERWLGGPVRLISSGTGAVPVVTFHGASPDGRRVWFETFEAIAGTGDTDNGRDVYERTSNGGLTLMSTGGTNDEARFVGAAADGSRVWFRTQEAIPGQGDSDTGQDIYERHTNGTLSLVSKGGVANLWATFAGASADGSRVWFETSEAIPGTGDADTVGDVYECGPGGVLRLLTYGSSTWTEGFLRGSADGSRVWFQTWEAIPGTGDTDTTNDIYERRKDGALRLITT